MMSLHAHPSQDEHTRGNYRAALLYLPQQAHAPAGADEIVSSLRIDSFN
jgi:hypothetical protein